jgi:hypothetical protein
MLLTACSHAKRRSSFGRMPKFVKVESVSAIFADVISELETSNQFES